MTPDFYVPSTALERLCFPILRESKVFLVLIVSSFLTFNTAGFLKKPSAVICCSLGMSDWRLAIEKGLTKDCSLF